MITYRKATIEDIPALVKLHRDFAEDPATLAQPNSEAFGFTQAEHAMRFYF